MGKKLLVANGKKNYLRSKWVEKIIWGRNG